MRAHLVALMATTVALDLGLVVLDAESAMPYQTPPLLPYARSCEPDSCF
jgi:hypothetical protein